MEAPITEFAPASKFNTAFLTHPALAVGEDAAIAASVALASKLNTAALTHPVPAAGEDTTITASVALVSNFF